MNGVTYKDFPIIEVAHRLGIHIDRSTLGRSEVEAYCPFCNGSKNHLFLNPVSNQFFCQKCREGGNSVTLYAKMHGISNREAVDELDREAKTYPFPDTKVRSEPVSDNLALLERRHDVYYDLLCELQLNDAHLLDLLGRGLSLTRIGQNMYRSMPVRQTEKLLNAWPVSMTCAGCPGFILIWCPENGALPDRLASWYRSAQLQATFKACRFVWTTKVSGNIDG